MSTLRSSVLAYSVFLAALVLSATCLAAAQTSDKQIDAYLSAANKSRTADHIAALQQFASTAPNGNLKMDALTWLIWDYQRLGRSSEAAAAARKLREYDRDNPLVLAVLGEDTLRSGSTDPHALDGVISSAQQALANLGRLRKPQAMADAEFTLFNQHLTALLNGTLGQALVQRGQYASAAPYLRAALAISADDPQYAYALGLADVLAQPPNAAEGFWYLARAVNLTRGTSFSQRISEYARNLYQQSGGSAEQWNKFIAAAVVASPYQPSSGSTEVATATRPTPPIAATTVEVAPPAKSAHKRVAAKHPASKSKATTKAATARSRKPKSQPVERADEELPADVATVSPPKKPLAPRPGGPISLGILIEAADAKANRKLLLNGLSEVVRHLRPGEEAFVLSFGEQLEFEQDLTANYRLLEKAVDDIKPRSGAALYDAVAFAAGHLKRIAKNKNLVLLVISDGHNAKSETSPLQLAAEINGVRIYCIGMDVSGADGKYFLSALASHTGGWASFISDPRQFPAATQQMAQVMGISTPF